MAAASKRRRATGRVLGVLAVSLVWSAMAVAAEEAGVVAPATPAAADPREREAPSSVVPAPLQPGVPSLQMSTEFGSAITAIGGYRPVALLESGGVRMGPFMVRAAAQAGMGYNDNVTLASSNKTSSMVYTLSPSVSAGLENPLQRYYAVYRGNYGVYPSSSVDNYAEHNLGLGAAHDWTTRFRSLVTYDFARGQDARGATATAAVEPDKWQVHSVRGIVAYGADGAQGRIEGETGYLTRKYLTNRTVAGNDRDYDQVDLMGTFYWRVAPKTRALVEVRRAEITHDADRTLDATSMRYQIGATWDATAKTTGTVRVGIVTRDADSPVRPDFSGFTYDVSVTWLPLTYSAVRVGATRTVAEAVETGSNFVVDHIVSAAWTHAWSDRVQTVASYTYGNQEHSGLARTDTVHGLGLSATYAFQRRLRFGASYRHDVRNSNAPNVDFRRNITLITVETAL